ncbi:MAG TPA: hypothetical protein VIM55_04500 [Mucilaginibacter sp.]
MTSDHVKFPSRSKLKIVNKPGTILPQMYVLIFCIVAQPVHAAVE